MLPIILSLIPDIDILTTVAWAVAIGWAVWYYKTAIILAIFIMLYQWFLSLDIAATTGSALNNIASIITKNPMFSSLSILPKSDDPNTKYDNKVEWLRINNPMKIFLNINRAFLYIALFFSLLILYPFSSIMTFPREVYVSMFSMMNIVVMQLEPLALVIVVIIIAPLQKAVSVVAKFIKFVSA